MTPILGCSLHSAVTPELLSALRSRMEGDRAGPNGFQPAVRKLIEEAGGKVISFYVRTGESDFLLISETNEAEAVIAALMATSAAGTVSVMLAPQGLGPVRNSKQSPRGLRKRPARIDLQASADCSLAKFAAIRRASSRVSNLACRASASPSFT
jgi:hypothetical protein